MGKIVNEILTEQNLMVGLVVVDSHPGWGDKWRVTKILEGFKFEAECVEDIKGFYNPGVLEIWNIRSAPWVIVSYKANGFKSLYEKLL